MIAYTVVGIDEEVRVMSGNEFAVVLCLDITASCLIVQRVDRGEGIFRTCFP